MTLLHGVSKYRCKNVFVYSTVTVSCAGVLAGDVFGTGMFHWHVDPVPPHFLTPQFQDTRTERQDKSAHVLYHVTEHYSRLTNIFPLQVLYESCAILRSV
jgi:hypothetical protein